MSKKLTRLIVIQASFYTTSVILLHAFLFGWVQDIFNGDVYTSTYLKNSVFNWLPVFTFDVIVGFIIAAAITCVYYFMNLDLTSQSQRRFIYLVTAVINTTWLVFCIFWFQNNYPAVNNESFGHVISPFIVGLGGIFLAGINLILLMLTKKLIKSN